MPSFDDLSWRCKSIVSNPDYDYEHLNSICSWFQDLADVKAFLESYKMRKELTGKKLTNVEKKAFVRILEWAAGNGSIYLKSYSRR